MKITEPWRMERDNLDNLNPTFRVIGPGGLPRMSNESYAVASNVVHACNNGATGTGECDEVAAGLLGQTRGICGES